MEHEPAGHFLQSPDTSKNGLIFLVVGLTLSIFVISTAWGYAILNHHLTDSKSPASVGPKGLPLEANGREVGEVIHWMFDAVGDWPDLNKRQEQRLASYGWVDRTKGRIHIPIDRAIELTAQKAQVR